MPFDDTGFARRDLTAREASDLDALRRARAGIAAPGGWCKRRWGRDDAHCSLGWVIQEAGVLRGVTLACRLHTELPAGASGVVAYNDASATTQADVVALFDRAIARLEAADAV